ncbi:hypothetical protein BP6252_01546 [Coleophoma cylindrospora]|uniref:T6SS Phospholipase effector Tle1-like catalytic domain-containing protein n=1 Tax=Coleophoma cylindrospora TaxID=1849047 RepID=A0A3D8STE4_9HELO|nr:hypothetical protein BP6252_01546 [Coleophoma cylindrospora]
MSNPDPVAKRIVICCDGTWQSSVSGVANIPSNVTRLCRSIDRAGEDKDGKIWQQVVYYDSGVGTGSLLDLEKKRQGAIGDGLAVNVIEAYNFIVLNYSPGDEIFCFGFSRGAYTARAVAGLIGDIGIMEPRNMQDFPEVYDLYKKHIPKKETGYVQKPFRESQAWKDFTEGKIATTPEAKKLNEELDKHWRKTSDEEKRMLFEIRPHGDLAISEESRSVKVVGVWDTVGALGVPDGLFLDHSDTRVQYSFHNVKLNENIENAFQALALDERRKAFSPTLWYIPKDPLTEVELQKDGEPSKDGHPLKGEDPTKDHLPKNENSQTKKKSNLLQVWFPGVHINVGGGSSDTAEGKGDAEQIAIITFVWMVECVRPYLAFKENALQISLIEYTKLLGDLHCKNYHHHDPSKQPNILSQAFNAVYNSIPYIGGVSEPEAPVELGWGTANYNDSFKGLMAFPGAKVRKPGQCETEVVVEDTHFLTRNRYLKLKSTSLKALGETNEMVHPVARFRRDKLNQDTGGLQGWKHRYREDEKPGFEWYLPGGDVVLKEYIIQRDSIERELVCGVEEATKFLKDTDIGNQLPVE